MPHRDTTPGRVLPIDAVARMFQNGISLDAHDLRRLYDHEMDLNSNLVYLTPAELYKLRELLSYGKVALLHS